MVCSIPEPTRFLGSRFADSVIFRSQQIENSVAFESPSPDVDKAPQNLSWREAITKCSERSNRSRSTAPRTRTDRTLRLDWQDMRCLVKKAMSILGEELHSGMLRVRLRFSNWSGSGYDGRSRD